jgi:hypothetical protein
MTLTEFKESITKQNPPPGLSVYLNALWHDAKGNWEKAHHIIQDIEDKNAAWIHAFLHRKEGDTWNADYWYNRADRKRPAVSLEQEWANISESFLADI